MNYVDFLNNYCGKIELDKKGKPLIDARVAAWSYITTSDALMQSEFIDVFITKDFKKFTGQKKITVHRILGFLQRVEFTNELNKILGFKQHD
jgi:hypothetical protein